MAKIIDLVGIKESLAQLKEIAQEYPEAFGNRTEEEWMAILEENIGKKKTKYNQNLSLRVADELLERIDNAVITRTIATRKKVTRTEMVAYLLESALQKFEEENPNSPHPLNRAEAGE